MDRTRHWNVQSTVEHHNTSIKISLLTLWDMAVFKVADVENAALQCTTLYVCGGNFEH